MANIYKITNDINNKVYVGKTHLPIQKRWLEHCRSMNKNNIQNRPLYKAMQKYGINHFHIELVEITNHPNEREIFWINYYNSYKQGYNATLGGDGKSYVDVDTVINTYKQLGLITKTCDALNVSAKTVQKILRENSIPVIRDAHGAKPVKQLDDMGNVMQTYASAREAGRQLINNSQNKNHRTIGNRISKCCISKQKAYGYYWEFV